MRRIVTYIHTNDFGGMYISNVLVKKLIMKQMIMTIFISYQQKKKF